MANKFSFNFTDEQKRNITERWNETYLERLLMALKEFSANGIFLIFSFFHSIHKIVCVFLLFRFIW